MPLIKDNLKTQIDIIVKNCPNNATLAATQWSTAFFAYFSTGLAGVLTPLPSLTSTTLQAFFLISMANNQFMDNLGADLNKWLLASVWLGPGFTPGISVIAAALPTAPLGKAILNGADCASTLSIAIDGWAKTIMVTAVTTATPPVPTILPFS